MSANINATEEINTTVDAKKRAFMAKFGQYAVAGAGMSVLMAPSLSATTGSGATTNVNTVVLFDYNAGSWVVTSSNNTPPNGGFYFEGQNIFKNNVTGTTYSYTGDFGADDEGSIFKDGNAIGTWYSSFKDGDPTATVAISWLGTPEF